MEEGGRMHGCLVTLVTCSSSSIVDGDGSGGRRDLQLRRIGLESRHGGLYCLDYLGLPRWSTISGTSDHALLQGRHRARTPSLLVSPAQHHYPSQSRNVFSPPSITSPSTSSQSRTKSGESRVTAPETPIHLPPPARSPTYAPKQAQSDWGTYALDEHPANTQR